MESLYGDRDPGLESEVKLDTLNLCKNFISRIENLAHMTQLTTLLLSQNHLRTADDIRHVSRVDVFCVMV